MGEKVTFNPYTRIIQVDLAPTDGVVALDVKADLYSDGKEDWRADNTLNKLTFPIRVVGGQPLPGSKALGATFFLAPDWKIRPYEASHTFRVNGNLYSDDGTSPFISTVGAYNVFLEQQVSSLVDSTVQQLDEIEYASFNGGITYDEINGVSGTGYTSDGRIIGTPRAPSNNVYDARTIANIRGFTKGYLVGDMNIPEYELDGFTPLEIFGFTFQGSGKDRSVIDIPAIPEMYSCTYLDAKVTGYLDGDNSLNGCLVEDLDYIKGYVELCVLSDVGEITLGGSDLASFLGCFSSAAGAIINMGGSGQPLLVGDHHGSLTLKNKSGSESARIGLSDGSLKIDLTTVTAGTITVGGVGNVVDLATGDDLHSGTYGGMTLINNAINKHNISLAVWDYTGT